MRPECIDCGVVLRQPESLRTGICRRCEEAAAMTRKYSHFSSECLSCDTPLTFAEVAKVDELGNLCAQCAGDPFRIPASAASTTTSTDMPVNAVQMSDWDGYQFRDEIPHEDIEVGMACWLLCHDGQFRRAVAVDQRSGRMLWELIDPPYAGMFRYVNESRAVRTDPWAVTDQEESEAIESIRRSSGG